MPALQPAPASALVRTVAFPHHAVQENTARDPCAKFKAGNAVAESENIVAETAEKIFADLADAQTINNDKTGGWKAPLWQALTEAGLPLSWVPEDCAGSGASLAEGFSVLGAAGRFAIAVPLAETMLAGWLLAQARIVSPEGEMTVAPASPKDRIAVGADGTLSGRARGVPFARDAKHIAVLAGGAGGLSIALVDASACRIEAGLNLANDGHDTVTFTNVAPIAIKPAPKGFDQTTLMLMGGVARSLQIAGALESMLDVSVRYSNERVAFEKKISKFQAVQHNLAKLAGESAAALAAATSAADAIANSTSFDDAVFLEAASAKIRCSEAAEKGAAIAHQVHGAIGFTIEHILHRYTLRALAWRDDFGSESYWAVELGKLVAARGADELWPLVASR
ncbi:acyl-CoA dehydrogenase [Bradyrhizobium erythrophlei]|jgi:acyl-CoA dehydrogenase|uniref:Acyl-CoA dehydrogenase n=1 Tax=Bradyrhizobium erythrophlei TaxID=1437360 RepID=A0A1M5YDL2_9BRAD|nr:acyl-CoA dehydrogenase [Bradyrhizobium erythrophlei]